jgi:hypothetical protein
MSSGHCLDSLVGSVSRPHFSVAPAINSQEARQQIEEKSSLGQGKKLFKSIGIVVWEISMNRNPGQFVECVFQVNSVNIPAVYVSESPSVFLSEAFHPHGYR